MKKAISRTKNIPLSDGSFVTVSTAKVAQQVVARIAESEQIHSKPLLDQLEFLTGIVFNAMNSENRRVFASEDDLMNAITPTEVAGIWEIFSEIICERTLPKK